MKRLLFLFFAFLIFSSHDMFLKLDNYYLQPNSPALIKLYNGTFDKSENVIDRNRMIDVSLVGNGERSKVDTTQWSEKDSMTLLNFKTGEAGTWVVGLSTHARNIEMTAEDFNGYLEHDGVLDMIKWREDNNALDKDAIEKYSKHVKTIFQVGDKTTDDWKTILGYPIEFIPLSNPYEAKVGDELEVQLLWKGKPLSNQLVYLGSGNTTHSHEHNEDTTHNHDHKNDTAHNHDHETESGHHHHGTSQLRTDADGKLSVKLTQEGVWYLRTIHLINSEEEGLTHESNWSTLTFEIGHAHSEDVHHHSGTGISSYLFFIGSLILIIGLFFWFNRKK